ncbi:533_t:CDS:2 [Acaulospora colombiana]|uniref:533_t:CDS:1 n=1 Tax=Acaulospora colombiana TaxID=27376 RepID=A0ACA9LHT5_9GLOM|nr:533_t:CDS:2 [Acaulospora colombiana]
MLMLKALFDTFIATANGFCLLYLDDRRDTPRDTPDLLLDKLVTWHRENGSERDPPPVLNIDDVQFLFINAQDLYFVCTTKFNVSPFTIFELLGRIATLIKDFCGSLNEEILRLNSGLVYEILDEVIDYGYPQTTSTVKLKLSAYEEPIPVKRDNIIMNSLAKLKPSAISTGSSSNRPITLRDEKNSEVFIDVVERVVASFASNGMTVQAEINGAIQVKSYLQGNPEISLGLNSNIVLGRDSEITGNHL